MGRGTKHVADWKETTLQVVIDAKRLYCHSVKIMGNEKVFNPKNDFQNTTLIRIQESLLSVYTNVWDANPGSQMVQIAGIAYLNGFDHYVKETLRRKLYIRYMDDFHIIGRDDAELLAVRKAAEENLAKVGLTIHPTKTRIRSAKDGIVFLGFLFRVTESGKVLMLRDPKRVKEIKRRLRRLAHKVWRGDAEPGTIDKSYECVRACMAKGNSIRLLRRMDDFVSKLKKGIDV